MLPFLKQRAEILLISKIDSAHKIWEETHLREIILRNLDLFNKVRNWFVLAAMWPQLLFLCFCILLHIKWFNTQMCCKRYNIIFLTFEILEV